MKLALAWFVVVFFVGSFLAAGLVLLGAIYISGGVGFLLKFVAIVAVFFAFAWALATLIEEWAR